MASCYHRETMLQSALLNSSATLFAKSEKLRKKNSIKKLKKRKSKKRKRYKKTAQNRKNRNQKEIQIQEKSLVSEHKNKQISSRKALVLENMAMTCLNRQKIGHRPKSAVKVWILMNHFSRKMRWVITKRGTCNQIINQKKLAMKLKRNNYKLFLGRTIVRNS